jgi:hypothetical protein
LQTLNPEKKSVLCPPRNLVWTGLGLSQSLYVVRPTTHSLSHDTVPQQPQTSKVKKLFCFVFPISEIILFLNVRKLHPFFSGKSNLQMKYGALVE